MKIDGKYTSATIYADEVEETCLAQVAQMVNSVVESVLDEAPMAYKEAGFIESAIGPTAEIVDRLAPLHNIKAC